jgi:hypothetical protein
MREMSGAIIVIMKTEEDLCIFYEEKRKDTKNRVINTDENLVPVMINKIIPYRNLKEVRLFYGIDAQDLYFFIREKPFPDTVFYREAGYWTP